MNIVVITHVFPNAVEPHGGVFNLQQMAALRGEGVGIRIVAPVPWYPLMSLAGRWAEFSGTRSVPQSEVIDGFAVEHPRFRFVPRIGRSFYPWLYERSVAPALRALAREQQPDLLLATWAFPDAAGVARLAQRLSLPFAVKVHGSDLYEHCRYRNRRRHIAAALSGAKAVIAVSEHLGATAVGLGAAPERVHVIPNGVDTALFAPGSAVEARQRLGLAPDGPVVAQVGTLKQVKGPDILLQAFRELLRHEQFQRASLVLVGGGPLRESLAAQAARAGIADRVHFLGVLPHHRLPDCYRAADVAVCASRSEGTPNAVLEALACGVPVIATRVGGIPAILESAAAECLVPPGDPSALTAALVRCLRAPERGERWRRIVAGRSWGAGAVRLAVVLRSAAGLGAEGGG